MQINGGVRFCEPGMRASIRAMHLQSSILQITTENVNGFDRVGYQRREPVVSSFTEFLGVHGLSTTIDDQPGRIISSGNPLDIAIANRGYFQIETPDGVVVTRDGRFKYDKYGNLLTLEDNPVLSDSGVPIQLSLVPRSPDEIVVNTRGKISVFNPETRRMEECGVIGVVDANGMAVIDPDIKQGYNEYSNVSLQNEFLQVKPVVRNFEANRQLFIMQNTNLQSVISKLGSVS